MSEQPPAAAGRPRSRDSTILLAIAVLAILCGALSLGLQSLQQTPAVTASATDDARGSTGDARTPLPAGPKKYQ